MQLPTTLTAAVLLALSPAALAQSFETSTTSSAPSSTSSTPAEPTQSGLAGLVAQLPPCAIPCFDTAARGMSCALTDLVCLCSDEKRTGLTISLGTCLNGGLTGDGPEDDACQLSKLATLATDICTEVQNNPDRAELDQASAIVSAALADASPTNGNTQDGDDDSGAARPQSAAMMGVLVAFAGYAALAL